VSPDAAPDEVQVDVVRDEDPTRAVGAEPASLEPACLEQQMCPAREFGRIDGRRQGLVEPEGKSIEPARDIRRLVEVDQAQRRPLSPLRHGGEHLAGRRWRGPHDRERGPQIVEEADERRPDRDRRDAARRIAENRLSGIGEHEPGGRRSRSLG
jgi:hypothetical protein